MLGFVEHRYDDRHEVDFCGGLHGGGLFLLAKTQNLKLSCDRHEAIPPQEDLAATGIGEKLQNNYVAYSS